jgi:hypothetical protein
MRLLDWVGHGLPFAITGLIFSAMKAFKEINHFAREIAVGDQRLASSFNLTNDFRSEKSQVVDIVGCL